MDVFDLSELTNIVCVTGRLEETEEKRPVYTNSDFLTEIIHTTQCLLDFISALEKGDLFVLSMLVENDTT
jgi:hypothetical protein